MGSSILLQVLGVFLLASVKVCESQYGGFGPATICGPVCAIFCPSGYVLDSRGCPTCQCREPATAAVTWTTPKACPLCRNFCEHGRQVGANGCELCTCKPAPVTPCPPVLCENYCPSGRVKDSKGCDTCQCKTGSFSDRAFVSWDAFPVCQSPLQCICNLSMVVLKQQASWCSCTSCLPLFLKFYPTHVPANCPLCRNECIYGREVRADGCESCTCKPNPRTLCPHLNCRNVCPNGRVVDSNGCDTCTCKAECPTCTNFCPFGRVIRNDGCESCTCQPSPMSRCLTLNCFVRCEFGTLKDSNGCDTCQCKPAATNCPLCFNYCQYGRVLLSNGCESCTCNLPPTVVCPAIRCASVCPFGNVKDANGCDTCQCRPPIAVEFCVPTDCPSICPNGYVKDGFGCDTCQCLSGSQTKCPADQCSLFCDFGFQHSPLCKCECPVRNKWY